MGSFTDYNALGLADPKFTLDIMANTDCTYYAACAALAVWDSMGIPPAKRCFDNGDVDRSLKIGYYDAPSGSMTVNAEPCWIATLV